MSAITGIYHINRKSPDSHTILRMTHALAHRGPDGCDTWQAGQIALAQCMLRTTPESLHEHLPLTSDDGMLTITADARIDNREELMKELNLNQEAGIIPDSTLILQAYQKWGDDCVDNLLGDFAFAIWDEDRQHLFCARDHMGVKPFYYYCSSEIFAFGTEIKALFSVPGIPREVNEKGLAFRLGGVDPDPSITSYSHIRRLPAAHVMIVSPSGTHIHRYWSLDPHREIRFKTDEEYKTAFRKIFGEAVRCRMRSAFPIGSELSGGLDSSSVVCVARHIIQEKKGDTGPGPLHTFSAVFDEVPVCDERTWINFVLAGGNLIPHFIYPEQKSPMYDIKKQIAQSEEMLLFPTSHTFETIFQTATDNGIRVVLSGEWGDSVVSYGRGAFFEWVVAGNLVRANREITLLSKKFRTKKRTIIWDNLLRPVIPAIFRRHSPHPAGRWIRDDFAQRTGLAEYFVHLRNADMKLKTSRECHFHDLTTFPFSLSIEEADRRAAAHSVENRFPFLDRRVIEFCLGLPPEQRIRNGLTRAIEREALAVCLPPEIQQRTSKGFADPYIKYSLIKFEGEKLKDYLSGYPDVRFYVNLDFVLEMYDKLMKGSPSFILIHLWRSILLAIWLREEDLIRTGKNSQDKSAIKSDRLGFY